MPRGKQLKVVRVAPDGVAFIEAWKNKPASRAEDRLTISEKNPWWKDEVDAALERLRMSAAQAKERALARRRADAEHAAKLARVKRILAEAGKRQEKTAT